MEKPLVSVCIITYNHAQYISQAIDSVLMQKVSFPWEIIIADDCSTDGTREILLDYKETHPELIKLLLQEKNVGPKLNWKTLLCLAEGSFVAYLEGDDYWVNSDKLTMQLDIMKNHPRCNAVFTNVKILNIERPIDKIIYSLKDQTKVYWNDLFFNGQYMKLSSILYRNSNELKESLLIHDYPCDETSFGLYLLEDGQYGCYLDVVACTYREHDQGTWSLLNNYQKLNNFFWVEEVIKSRYLNLFPDKKSEVEKRYFLGLVRKLSAAITIWDIKAMLKEVTQVIKKFKFEAFYIKTAALQIYIGVKLFFRSILIKK